MQSSYIPRKGGVEILLEFLLNKGILANSLTHMCVIKRRCSSSQRDASRVKSAAPKQQRIEAQKREFEAVNFLLGSLT